jgi:small subunit ribosomal protein S1
MSDTEKPEPTPAQPPAQAPEAAPAQTPPPPAAAGTPEAPPAAGKPAGPERRGDRPRRGSRPQGSTPRSLPVPDLTRELALGQAPSLRELDKEIEGDLEAALAGLSEKDLLGGEAPRKQPDQPGTPSGRKLGRVLSVRGPDVFVDVPGGRTQGVLPLLQFPQGAPAPGTEVEVGIEGYDNANGLLLLTRKGAAVEADWADLAVGMIVEARVTATNKGGLEVDVNGIRGFMPISQIDLYRVENAEQYINQRLRCEVTEADRAERNLVVSRRNLLEREREESRERLWQELAEGQVRDGVVRSVRDFGAFVDLGGVDGLLHVSEMSWQRVQDPTTIVQPGQAVKVAVLRIDREKRKVSLGLKQLTASPWDTIAEKYPHSHIFKGTVTRLMDFGAFVELEPGVEGLIHISELAPQRVRRVSDIVKPGQEVQVMVLSVDRERRRLSLSLKAAVAEAEEPAAEAEEAEEEVEVKPPRPRTTPLRGGIGDQAEYLPPEA